MEESQKYVVYTVFRNVEVKLGVFDTLADAYDCVRLVGKKTSRKFSIYSVKTEFLERITVHDIKDRQICI